MNANDTDSASNEILLSILIPTLNDRKHYYQYIAQRISKQIKSVGQQKVELLVYCDNREKTTGHKRNVLLEQSKGRFVVFVDDDDDISGDYVKNIVDVIESMEVDAIGICGIYTENGMNPTPFITGREYNWNKSGGRYCRFVNHISPIRSTIAKQFKFPDITIGEDYQWTMAIRDSGLIKTDHIIMSDMYFYEFRTNKQ